jgi:hypothetical protein
MRRPDWDKKWHRPFIFNSVLVFRILPIRQLNIAVQKALGQLCAAIDRKRLTNNVIEDL